MRTRFAPSPTGRLHLGHAFSALSAWHLAAREGGTCLLRLEDIDGARCRPEFEAAIYDDLRWLGLDWPEPVMRQSDRLPVYAAALADLRARGLVYPCTCTRRDIAQALSAPQEGSDKASVYPGTCRGRTDTPEVAAWRLDMRATIAELGGEDAVAELFWEEIDPDTRHHIDPAALVAQHGDVVLARRDIGTSYHIAVVVDDAAQAITHVVRGQDMRDVTPVHRLLQALFNLPVPVWHHHALIRDETGKRLAKRDDARALSHLRGAGATPADIREMVGLSQAIGSESVTSPPSRSAV